MKTYEICIQVFSGKDVITSRHNYDVDKEDFLSMVTLIDYLDYHLFEMEIKYDEDSETSFRMALKVSNDDEILFGDLDSYNQYKTTHIIESRLMSNWSLALYVNDILFRGVIEEGMIIK